jgi:uncharacterized damage-inducible protein DinB
MVVSLTMTDLIDYTDWERQKWFDWLRQRGQEVLEISLGPHGDGRFEKVGESIRHIFSAEKRYIERLSDRPMTDTAAIPACDIEALSQLGQQSRRELREFIEAFPSEAWDSPREFKLMSSFLTATPKKIVTHVLVHEIRHWAQIATVLRAQGLKDDFHDFLFSPVMGGELRRATPTG